MTRPAKPPKHVWLTIASDLAFADVFSTEVEAEAFMLVNSVKPHKSKNANARST